MPRSQPKRKIPASASASSKHENNSSKIAGSRARIAPQSDLAVVEKNLLYWRHKLQKGLLVEGQQLREEDMELMSDHLRQLERFPHLPKESIRTTKVNKLLKLIINIGEIPGGDAFLLIARSETLLEVWNKTLEGDEDATANVLGKVSDDHQSQATTLPGEGVKLTRSKTSGMEAKNAVYTFKHSKDSDGYQSETLNLSSNDRDAIGDHLSEVLDLYGDAEDDMRWGAKLLNQRASKRKQKDAIQEDSGFKASIVQRQSEVIDLLSDDEGATNSAEQSSQSKASETEDEGMRNLTVIPDEIIPITLKRRRPHIADQESRSNSDPTNHPRKNRRISSSARENRNEKSPGVNDIVTPHAELIQLIEESALGFGKIAANLERIATSLKNHPGW